MLSLGMHSRRSANSRLAHALLVLLLCVVPALQAQPAPRATVASPHPLASEAGLSILLAGGNAFDAAVAVAAALAVVEPYGSGLGGGGFFLLRQGGSSPSYLFIDARERAPLKARPDLYLKGGQAQRRLSLDGPLAAAIPGIPAGLAELSSRHGRLSLEQSLAPAIRLAREGFPVDRVYQSRAQMRLAALRDDAESARLFLDAGEVPAQGFVLRQPELAASLEQLASAGHAGFYSGELATRLVEGVNRAGGIWSMEDLASYQVVERIPLQVSLADDRQLITAPPPSAGGVAIAQSLLMLQQLPWREAERAQRAHLVAEVLRRAYHDRRLIGDPDYVDTPLPRLLAPDYLEGLTASISSRKATPSTSLGTPAALHEGEDTTHFSILDGDGNAVAATLSINLPFGAAFTVPGTGVLLNDEMDDFAVDPAGSNAYDLEASQANLVGPGRRPLSSMTPTFIDSADQLASFGTPGGSRIPSMVLLAILEYLDEQPVQAWVAAGRYHHQFHPDRIQHEPDAFDEDAMATLRERGHTLDNVGRRYGNQQVILWHKSSGQVDAASDPRGIGQSLQAPAAKP
ncbi:gamma-glutamyltransferase [Pseudomonas mangrovi]|uniref:Glutathione hydrolase proenzyme n=2 Tax=Pseudomonas mangrovi TaxID=2161748 RepID=A0A2T5P5G2_9PSED|nr:gamma-glutamyltransferase [Pseudomonas mangrovi]